MEAELISRQDNKILLHFDVELAPEHSFLTHTSKKFLCGAVGVQVEVNTARCCKGTEDCFTEFFDGHVIISVKCSKLFMDNLHYTCKVSSIKLKKEDLLISACDEWHKIHHFCARKFGSVEINNELEYSFDITLVCDIAESTSPYALLYEDTVLADFELHGEGGTISVHKTVLAASSPVFKTMLCGDWKETNEGRVAVAGATQEHLHVFKEYMYLHKLPETDIRSLLVLGSYYMMSELVQKCVAKLINKLDSDNLTDIMELAVKFKLDNLFMSVLNCVKYDIIGINEIRAINFDKDIQRPNDVPKKVKRLTDFDL
ncbi:kelch-like protein 6 [Pectinophora gossypiella]|uniref:kelch-like protein 6 n=1 Tax=Pectinophora gossypiella TaxID=13191 RepID=UPI00214E3220|nr:kelch-like protein 6 [Pectinophora gossypiella]